MFSYVCLYVCAWCHSAKVGCSQQHPLLMHHLTDCQRGPLQQAPGGKSHLYSNLSRLTELEYYWPKITDLCSPRTNSRLCWIRNRLQISRFHHQLFFCTSCFFCRKRLELIFYPLIPAQMAPWVWLMFVPMFFQNMDFQTRSKGKEMSVLFASGILFRPKNKCHQPACRANTSLPQTTECSETFYSRWIGIFWSALKSFVYKSWVDEHFCLFISRNSE